MEHRQSEQGGVGVFIIVGVLLTTLLVGGLFLAKQQGQSAHDNAGVTTQQTEQTGSTNDSGSNESTSTSSTDNSSSTQPSQTQDSTQSSTTSSSSTSTTGSSTVVTTGPSGDGSGVPSTGPGDTLAIVAVLAVGVAGIGSYIRSRKHVRASALR